MEGVVHGVCVVGFPTQGQQILLPTRSTPHEISYENFVKSWPL